MAKKTLTKPPHPNSVLKFHVATINSLTEYCKESTKKEYVFFNVTKTKYMETSHVGEAMAIVLMVVCP